MASGVRRWFSAFRPTTDSDSTPGLAGMVV